MNGYYNPPEEDRPQGIDWTDTLYTLFLIGLLIWLGFAVWNAHKNGPCYRDPIPAEYLSSCPHSGGNK